MEGILYASREMELVKVFAWRSVEQSFPTTRVLGYQNRVTKSLSREETRFPRPTAYIRGRSLKKGDFILFSVRSLASVSPFTTGMHLVREKCSDVKRRLLRSIFARCTFLNANRACENSRDFIAGAPSFLHGLCIFMRLCKLSHIGIFKDTFLLFK